jgi:alanyl aminopeptidase
MIHALAALLLVAAASGLEDPPALRLPGNVKPVRQAVELTIDPAAESFEGRVEVELAIASAAPVVWLNATGLTVTAASFGFSNREVPARIVPGGDDFVGFAIGDALGVGSIRLKARFTGRISRVEHEGLFAMKEGGDWYAFTQFEPIAARKAFPCFDEPNYKIPWRLALRVPKGLVAAANAPLASTTEEGGLSVVRFAETRPLPSYLVALAVGPFDVVDVGPAGRNKVPTRLLVPKGRGGDTAWARESTPSILALLEDYFDRPYPYEKLDQVAIPGVGFAMEHPGLVTYGMGSMVQRAEEDTISSRRGWAGVCAHELAHQWFGDLVTMAWWDDLWLNEAFASWLGQKTTDRFKPEWGGATSRVASRSSALQQDSLASARRIREPITSKHDIKNAFDGITYSKGQAVLEMTEAWLGEESFRGGVRAYLKRHAWGNASASDFLSALSGAANRDVGPLVGTFLNQTGAPVIAARIECQGSPKLLLRQSAYRALGSPPEARTWRVPICAKLGARSGVTTECTVLAEETGEIVLPRGAACPEWAFANTGAAGYYRVAMTVEQARAALVGGQLTPAERVGLVGDLAALVGSGDVPAGDGLALAPLVAKDAERQVVQSGIGLVRGTEALVPEALLPRYAALVRELYGMRARQMGFSRRPGDDEDTRLLRRTLLSSVGLVGDDAELGRAALPLATSWLEDPKATDPDLVDTILSLAVHHGDRAFYDRVKAAALGTNDRRRRQRLLVALGFVRDPALAKDALALTLDERLDARESIAILQVLSGQRETRALAFDFARANYVALAGRIPSDWVSFFPWMATGFCDGERRAETEAFYRDRMARVDGGPRSLDQALEAMDQCIARRQAQQASVARFLESR